MELHNIDLEITFSNEPYALLSEVQEAFTVLFAGRKGDLFLLVLEVFSVGYSEEEIIRSFLETLSRISEEAKKDLAKALKREFNFGYGLDRDDPMEASIPHPLVRLIGDSGYSLGVTFYRPR